MTEQIGTSLNSHLYMVLILTRTSKLMKTFLLTLLTAFFITSANGQVSFLNIDIKLKVSKTNDSTQLICSGPKMSLRFKLKGTASIVQENNFATIDSQIIQIVLLKFSGYKKDPRSLSMTDQKQLLSIYSNYELEYFKNELNMEVVNASNQWVVTKSKGWFIWYFRVGHIPTQVTKPTVIQLFASTVIGDKVLTLNAPIQSDSDFNKAGLIVNEMMETLVISKS
jgi:hypothetical protein